MREIMVVHQHQQAREGYTMFSGPDIDATAQPDGSLMISAWQKDAKKGMTLFAKGVWCYVSISDDM